MSLVRLFDTLAFEGWNPLSIFGTAAASGADAWLASDTSAFADTHIETRETPDAYVFSARLPPGVAKEELSIRVEVDDEDGAGTGIGIGNVLVIAGERSVRREAVRGDARRQHVIERSRASFFGRFHLPADAAVDRVRAAMDADAGALLTVTVPRLGAAAVVVVPEAAAKAVAVETSPC